MLIDSNDIKKTKKHMEIMQAFLDGKKIEYERINRTNVSEIWKECISPIWDFDNYTYRIKPSDKKFTNPLHSHSDSFWEHSKHIEKTHNLPFFHSIMADQFVELGMELPDYMVEQLSQEKLEYLTKKAERLRKETGYQKFEESIMECTETKPSEPEYKYPIYKQSKHGVIVQFTGLNTGTYVKKTVSYNVGEEANDLVEHTCKEYWDDYDPKNDVFKYPIYKESKEYGTIVKFTGLDSGEYMNKTFSFNAGDYNNNLVEHTDNTFWKDYSSEFIYPIYKRLKATPETVVKFHSIDTGIYISTHKNSIYIPGDASFNIAPHTDSSWEDYHVSADAEKAMLNKENTIELFEVMVYCDILKEFMIKQVLYSQKELDNYPSTIKTGRSFIIDEETKQIIKIKNKKKI